MKMGQPRAPHSQAENQTNSNDWIMNDVMSDPHNALEIIKEQNILPDANINIPSPSHGNMTLLMMAAARSKVFNSRDPSAIISLYTDIIQTLYTRGATIDAIDDHGRTVFHHIAGSGYTTTSFGSERILRALFECFGKIITAKLINQKDSQGKTALDYLIEVEGKNGLGVKYLQQQKEDAREFSLWDKIYVEGGKFQLPATHSNASQASSSSSSNSSSTQAPPRAVIPSSETLGSRLFARFQRFFNDPPPAHARASTSNTRNFALEEAEKYINTQLTYIKKIEDALSNPQHVLTEKRPNEPPACSITLEAFKNPIWVYPSGHSYERSVLEELFSKTQFEQATNSMSSYEVRDPLTQEPITRITKNIELQRAMKTIEDNDNKINTLLQELKIKIEIKRNSPPQSRSI